MRVVGVGSVWCPLRHQEMENEAARPTQPSDDGGSGGGTQGMGCRAGVQDQRRVLFWIWLCSVVVTAGPSGGGILSHLPCAWVCIQHL